MYISVSTPVFREVRKAVMESDSFKKLKDSARYYLNLGKRESEVFAYKVIGISTQEISKIWGVGESTSGANASTMFKKLGISHRLDRDEVVKELGEELLLHYDDLVAPLVEHDAVKMLEQFKALDKKLGR